MRSVEGDEAHREPGRQTSGETRPSSRHLGAALLDAGIARNRSYRSVRIPSGMNSYSVRPRIREVSNRELLTTVRRAFGKRREPATLPC